jgi:hypothetical protein
MMDVMKKILKLLSLVLLAACGMPNHTLLRPRSDIPSTKPGMGTVILGVSAPHFGVKMMGTSNGEMLVHLTPLLPPQDGKEFLGVEHYEVMLNCSALDQRPCTPAGAVRVVQLPPGRYAISGVAAYDVTSKDETRQNFFKMATYPWVESVFQQNGVVVKREYSRESFANPNTPTFMVEAGKVTYIGTLELEFAKTFEMQYRMIEDNAAVKELLVSPDAMAQNLVRAPIWGGQSAQKIARTSEGLH